jgi:hypothetical protein
MTPVIIINVIPQKPKATRPAIEDFANDIKCVLPQPDGHVEYLVLGCEVVHLMIEDRDETVDARLEFKNGALRIERCDDTTAESMFCLVALFEIATPVRDSGIETLVEGRLEEDVLRTILCVVRFKSMIGDIWAETGGSWIVQLSQWRRDPRSGSGRG